MSRVVAASSTAHKLTSTECTATGDVLVTVVK
jgi:hypothetical protein